MCLRRDYFKRIARAPAKLNLYLELFGRRSDGFHELETLMVPVQLCDTIALTPTAQNSSGSHPGEINLQVRGGLARAGGSAPQSLPPAGEENLVVRALRLLQQRSGTADGADVELVKRIPLAAGLGGGSSDAAAALRLANVAWGLRWNRDQLSAVATELGSDVPFFLQRRSAICRGRGERVEPVGGLASLHFVVVKPPVDLSTAAVYATHREHSATHSSSSSSPAEGRLQLAALVAALAHGRRNELRRLLVNRLAAAAGRLTHWIGQMQAAFRRLDVLGHQLSGSGSAYFGICRHAGHARRLAAQLRTRQLGLVFVTRSYS